MDGLAPSLPLPVSPGSQAQLEGKVKRTIFDAVSGEMRIFEVEDDDKVVHTVRQFANGSELAPLKSGDQVRIMGRHITHKRFGKQFDAIDLIKRTPTTAQGIGKIISGKSFKGIGPAAANKIIDALGSDLLSVLNRGDPGELLSDIIGHKKAQVLIHTWLKDQASNMTDATLADLGIGPETRKRIKEKIPEIDQVIQSDPYRIAKEIDGIGFKTADQMARRAGVFKEDSPQRLSVGISHSLDLAGQEGHTGLSRNQLIDKACEELTFGDRATISKIIDQEIDAENLIISPNDLIQTRWTAIRESRLARSLVKLARKKRESPFVGPAMLRVIGSVQAEHQLNDEQFAAVTAGLKEPLSVVTGGPGTGKTRTIKALIWACQEAAHESGVEYVIKCLAPTGMAADRMTDSTGHEASTVHSGLGRDFDTGGFLHNADNPFECDLVIADEQSMMDTRLTDSLIQAIDSGRTRLVMVGDVNQLASVDPGRVLYDIIQSQICPVTRFDRVYRTGPGSAIAVGAAEINKGKMPDFDAKSDLVFSKQPNAVDTASRIVTMVSETIPKYKNLTPDDIMVLCPGKNSPVGVNSLNIELQAAINPNEPLMVSPRTPVIIGNGQRPRMGDRIMCTKTNYQADPIVFNGDIGKVVDLTIEGDEAYLHIDCRKKTVIIPQSEWRNLYLAYAITIHKSQGSEYPVVVIPMTTSHYMMLKRNLVYTGVTRAKQLCAIVGDKRALQIALNTTDGTSRQTGLLARIKEFDRPK